MLDILKRINEWWETGNVPIEFVPKTRRTLFNTITDLLQDRRIISIIGPRRTGKTTLLFQIMDFLIREKKISPMHALFFSGDDIELRNQTDLIGQAIKTYVEDFLKIDYRSEQLFIFIDEIHKIKDWELWLKKFYDLKYNVKFIISGSSAAKIKRQQKESLAGRLCELTLFPMTFSEFLRFNGEESFDKLDLKSVTYLKLKTIKDKIGPKKELKIKRLFDTYLKVGGFPEWFEVKNIRKWYIRLKEDVLRRIIYDDIAAEYNLKNTRKLEDLFYLLSSLQSQAYSYNSMANTLKIDNEAAEQYVHYLEESFLLFEMRNYAASAEKQIRRNYKYVVVDNGMRNAINYNFKLDEQNIGLLVEGCVQQQVLWTAKQELISTYYWSNGKEVDIVLDLKDRLLPIEVKYRSDASDMEGLIEFMNKFSSELNIIVTKDLLKEEKVDNRKVIFVPAWLFLAVN